MTESIETWTLSGSENTLTWGRGKFWRMGWQPTLGHDRLSGDIDDLNLNVDSAELL